MTTHEHCDNCFISRCSYAAICPVVPCEFGCAAKLHRCKMSDHSLVCSSQKISCINSHYGCPAKVVRSRLSSHLVDCPANVIFCTMDWGRYPFYSGKRLRWVPLQKGCLDVELALRDQKVINKIRREKIRRGSSKTHSQRYDPKTKLSYERARCISQEITNCRGNTVFMDGDDSKDYRYLVDDAVSALDPTDPEVKPESQVSGETVTLTNEIDDRMNEQEIALIPQCPQMPDSHSGLGLSLTVENFPRFMRNDHKYRVTCGQVLRRWEYVSHFKNVHCDIHGGLGWMEQRCPLAQYGCPFVMFWLRPSTQEASVVFSQSMGTFGIKPLKSNGVFPKECYLFWLPTELLDVICQWLDSFSLRNLSMTCKALHNHVYHLLPKRGVVTVQWKKRLYEDGSVSWIIHEKHWTFTKAFSEVGQWVYSEAPSMLSHMETCPFYEKHRHERPFSYGAFS